MRQRWFVLLQEPFKGTVFQLPPSTSAYLWKDKRRPDGHHINRERIHGRQPAGSEPALFILRRSWRWQSEWYAHVFHDKLFFLQSQLQSQCFGFRNYLSDWWNGYRISEVGHYDWDWHRVWCRFWGATNDNGKKLFSRHRFVKWDFCLRWIQQLLLS